MGPPRDDAAAMLDGDHPLSGGVRYQCGCADLPCREPRRGGDGAPAGEGGGHHDRGVRHPATPGINPAQKRLCAHWRPAALNPRQRGERRAGAQRLQRRHSGGSPTRRPSAWRWPARSQTHQSNMVGKRLAVRQGGVPLNVGQALRRQRGKGRGRVAWRLLAGEMPERSEAGRRKRSQSRTSATHDHARGRVLPAVRAPRATSPVAGRPGARHQPARALVAESAPRAGTTRTPAGVNPATVPGRAGAIRQIGRPACALRGCRPFVNHPCART